MRRVPRLNMAEAVDATAAAVVETGAEIEVAAAVGVAEDADVTKLAAFWASVRPSHPCGAAFGCSARYGLRTALHPASESGANCPDHFSGNANACIDGSQPRM
jgi:hypothetical protein